MGVAWYVVVWYRNVVWGWRWGLYVSGCNAVLCVEVRGVVSNCVQFGVLVGM